MNNTASLDRTIVALDFDVTALRTLDPRNRVRLMVALNNLKALTDEITAEIDDDSAAAAALEDTAMTLIDAIDQLHGR
jgi:hypothetical protein